MNEGMDLRCLQARAQYTRNLTSDSVKQITFVRLRNALSFDFISIHSFTSYMNCTNLDKLNFILAVVVGPRV